MRCLPGVYNEKGSVWASNLSTDEKYDNESGKTHNNKWWQIGYVACDRISFFFWNANKNFRVAGKIRVGRETGNTHIYFFGLKGYM